MNTVLSAIIIDDEPVAIEVVKRFAAQQPFIRVVASFTNAFKAKEAIPALSPDLLFLDIQMPGMTGLDLIRLLPDPPMIIFTTAYSNYAVESYELQAVDYLLKPFSPTRFAQACNRALELNTLNKRQDSQAEQSWLQVKSGNITYKVHFSEIRYIESAGNYVSLVLGGRKVMTRMTMATIESKLPPNAFIRIHKSYIVARAAVTALASDKVMLGNSTLPVGPSFWSEVKTALG